MWWTCGGRGGWLRLTQRGTSYIGTWRLFIYREDNAVRSAETQSASDAEERDEVRGEVRVTRGGGGERGDECWAERIREEGDAVLDLIGCCYGWRRKEERMCWLQVLREAPHDSPFKQPWMRSALGFGKRFPQSPSGENVRETLQSVYLFYCTFWHHHCGLQFHHRDTQWERNIPNQFLFTYKTLSPWIKAHFWQTGKKREVYTVQTKQAKIKRL